MKDNKDSATPNEILRDLNELVAEAQALIAEPAREHSVETIDSLHARFAAAQERFAAAFAGARKRIVAGAKCTDAAIRENPYQSLAIAAGVGLLIGVFLGRRSK
jgi:ElaB/YqjD/DUF883 family membrane-anchored ribosome-binding protein